MSSKNNDTRTRILKAAWTLLEKHQGGGVSMADIAKGAKISRQALYLHFKTRTDILIATTHYVDDVKGIDRRLAASRAAKAGRDRLDAFIEAWGNYIPEIYGVGRVLLALRDSDTAADRAWHDRMQAVREGCEAAIIALKKDGDLSSNFTVSQATNILWVLLSVPGWVQLTRDCGWSQENYITHMKQQARILLVA